MKRAIIIIVAVIVVATASIAAYLYHYLRAPKINCEGEEIYLYIDSDESIDELAEELSSMGLITHPELFKRFADLKGYSPERKPGRYEIRANCSVDGLLNMLRLGEQSPVDFTFNNIRTIEELSSVVSRYTTIDSASLMTLLTDEAFIDSLDFTKESLPAMFLPNTYKIYWNVTSREFLLRMKSEYDRFWNESRRAKAEAISLSPLEVITLASIVEEESNLPKEFPMIAGVYLNRLKRGMMLYADPTVKYAAGDFTIRRILKKHTEIDSPYNTYKYPGLPPGPIRITSIQVIDSVLNPTQHNYLYFCAKPDMSGENNYAKTLAEHNRNAAAFHKALDERKIYK